MEFMKQLILASGSPRRRELLEDLGYSFEVITSPAEELHCSSLALNELCEHNAMLKSRAVAERYPEAIVLGGDTLVYIDSEPLGKPKNIEEAKQTLAKLSGRKHKVCSGMCLIADGKEYPFHEVTTVHFKTLDREGIEAYMAKVDVMDKAGSYAVQECGEMIIEKVDGDLSNVIGLPQQLVDRQLRALGLKPSCDRA